MPISVAIVEDQPAIRGALVSLIEKADGLSLFGSFGRAEDLFDALTGQETTTPMALIVLMDIGLPGMDGIEATARLAREFADCEVVMLTVFEDEERIFCALEAGASGYLLKSASGDDIIEAIAQIARGESPMSGSIARKVVASFHAPRPGPETRLSPRQREILDLLVAGLRYKEIADRLAISIDTVRTHIRHIYDKLHVRSRSELTARLMRPRRG